MRPFSLGHHLLLRALGMPYAGNPDADCGPDDIVVGLVICGMS